MASRTEIVTVSGIAYHTILNLPTSSQTSLISGAPNIGRGLILLSHALMANSTMWDSTVEALTDAGFACLRFDHVGHGRTPVPDELRPRPLVETGPYVRPPQLHFDSIAGHMHDLVQSVTGQDQVRAVIGCSMGGVLALRFAMLFPSCLELDGCVIACDPPGATSLEEAKPKWSQRIEQFARDEAEGTEVLRHATVERWIPFPPGEGESTDPETVKARAAALSMVKSCSFDGYRLCADGIRNYAYSSQLHQVKARTVVLVGELDEAVGSRAVTEQIADSITGARYVWMPKAGHLPPLHRSKAFENVAVKMMIN